MAKDYIQKYNGKYIEVTDNEILEASVKLSKSTGLFAEPAAASALAGYLKFLNTKTSSNENKSLILLTGSGLKDLSAVNQHLKNIEPIDCNIDEVKKLLHL